MHLCYFTSNISDVPFDFQGYNLHLNGEYHCSVRYKQLHNFNEQLKKLYGPENVPSFPPKKLFPLSVIQIEERRTHLEKYMQSCKNIIVVVKITQVLFFSIFLCYLAKWFQEFQKTVLFAVKMFFDLPLICFWLKTLPIIQLFVAPVKLEQKRRK